MIKWSERLLRHVLYFRSKLHAARWLAENTCNLSGTSLFKMAEMDWALERNLSYFILLGFNQDVKTKERTSLWNN